LVPVDDAPTAFLRDEDPIGERGGGRLLAFMGWLYREAV
jgi:hypothetical protein